MFFEWVICTLVYIGYDNVSVEEIDVYAVGRVAFPELNVEI